MNWVDLIIIIIILLFAFEGQRRGFFIQVIDIVGFLVALLASLAFYSYTANLLIKYFTLQKIVALPVGFMFIWIVTETIFFLVFDNFFKRFPTSFGRTAINRYFGFVPAIANSLLFLAFVLLFVVSLPISGPIKKNIFDSKIGSILVDHASVLERPLNNVFGPIAKQSLTFLTVKPEEKGSIALEYTQNQISIDYQSEKRMFELVNQERVKVGVAPLLWDEKQAEVGRKHSEDMFKRGYFSHYSPQGKDVGDRLEAAGIKYSFAGENLALAPDVSRAHTGLMNSEGHRRNILDPAFKKLGIGAIDGGAYGKMFTQVFTD